MCFFRHNIFVFYTDNNDVSLKRPLFSDNEDDNDNDILSDDDKTEEWRQERFKRESYLSEVTIPILL